MLEYEGVRICLPPGSKITSSIGQNGALTLRFTSFTGEVALLPKAKPGTCSPSVAGRAPLLGVVMPDAGLAAMAALLREKAGSHVKHTYSVSL